MRACSWARSSSVGADDLADGLRHAGLELQAIGVFGETCQAQRRGGDVPARIAQQRLDDGQVEAIAAVAPGLVGGAELLDPGQAEASAIFAKQGRGGRDIAGPRAVFGGAVGAIVAAHHQLRVEGVGGDPQVELLRDPLQVGATDSTVVAQAKIDRVAQAEVDHLLAEQHRPALLAGHARYVGLSAGLTLAATGRAATSHSTPRPHLFIAQRLDRLQASRRDRRIEPEEQPHQQGTAHPQRQGRVGQEKVQPENLA